MHTHIHELVATCLCMCTCMYVSNPCAIIYCSKMALEGELTKLRGHYAQVNDERNQLKRIVDEKDKEIEELIDSKNKSIKEKDQEINHLQEQLTKYGGNMPRPDVSGDLI